MPILHTPLVKRARAFAIKRHAGQTYGDEFPYALHLAFVESVGVRFDFTSERSLCGFWLHDTMEDTPTEYEELVALFGQAIADDVAALTEPKGGNRAWRHEQTYPKIAERGPFAVGLKLADRIANVEAGGSKVKMYLKEHKVFKEYIYIKDIPPTQDGGIYGSILRMQTHLDDLIAEV